MMFWVPCCHAKTLWLIPEQIIDLKAYQGQKFVQLTLPFKRLKKPVRLFVQEASGVETLPASAIYVVEDNGQESVFTNPYILMNHSLAKEQQLTLKIKNLPSLINKSLMLGSDMHVPNLRVHFIDTTQIVTRTHSHRLVGISSRQLTQSIVKGQCQYVLTKPANIALAVQVNGNERAFGQLDRCESIRLDVDALSNASNQSGTIELLLTTSHQQLRHLVSIEQTPVIQWKGVSLPRFMKTQEQVFELTPLHVTVNTNKPHVFDIDLLGADRLRFQPKILGGQSRLLHIRHNRWRVTFNGAGEYSISGDLHLSTEVQPRDYSLILKTSQKQWPLALTVPPFVSIQSQLVKSQSQQIAEDYIPLNKDLVIEIESNFSFHLAVDWLYQGDVGPGIGLQRNNDVIHALDQQTLRIPIIAGRYTLRLPVFQSIKQATRSGRYYGTFHIEPSY
ncbi:MAG: hypothetical protein OXE99_12200 [Cellvibrionales bacterium]|nr:hypothetical protein [Cellvibrionales bacterium]